MLLVSSKSCVQAARTCAEREAQILVLRQMLCRQAKDNKLPRTSKMHEEA